MKKLYFLPLFFFFLTAFAAEKPILKIVVTTDIHAQWESLEKVYGFMAEKNPDAVLFAGDLARYVGDEKSYKTYINIYNRHFSKCNPKPVHIPITGNHDYWENKGIKRLSPQDSLKRFFHPMGMKADWLQHHVVKGYTFIGVSATDEKGENNHTAEEIKQVSDLIDKAEKKAPGKPVFVLTHCPPAFTMAGSAWHDNPKKVWNWRYDHIRKMLAGHKQVVSLSGHTHLPLEDERSIWQGEFTAVNVGGLYKYSLQVPGEVKEEYIKTPSHYQYRRAFCYIEVFRKHMVIYRYKADTLEEINPENRWRIELPYDPSKAVYTMKRAEKIQSPEFHPGAKAELEKESDSYFISLTSAVHPDFVYAYKIKLIFDDKNLKPQDFYIASNFFSEKKTLYPSYQIPKNVKLVPGATGVMKITPVETFGKEGKSLSVRFQIP